MTSHSHTDQQPEVTPGAHITAVAIEHQPADGYTPHPFYRAVCRTCTWRHRHPTGLWTTAYADGAAHAARVIASTDYQPSLLDLIGAGQ